MRQQQSASWSWISWCIALVHFYRCKLQGFKAYEVHITVQVWLQVANDQLMRKMWMHWIGRSLSCDHWNILQKKKLDICKFTLILRIPLFSLFFIDSGIYSKLKDSAVAWDERLSLARHAWDSNDCVIPNKQQVLFDWIIQEITLGYKKGAK